MQRDIHQEKLQETRVIQTNQDRGRIPTKDLLFLDGESDESLEFYTRDPQMPSDRRLYARWILNWRETNGLVYLERDIGVIEVTHVAG